MSAKKAILKHGDVAIKDIIKEYRQLDDLDVFDPMLSRHLTKEQMAKALRSITVVKEKRCGRIKGKTVADGRAQRPYATKAESSSPTVGTDSLLLSMLIDAMEGRNVIIADIAGAFLKAPMKEFVLVKIDGAMVSYLVLANPTRYQRFVTMEYGKKVKYLRLRKALYGYVQLSKLWFDLFSTTLVDKLGFTLNPYDNCVANKMVNGSQLTVAWYVDDLKISHVNKDVVEETIKEIENHFDQMTVTRGKEHVYVGMHITLGDKILQIHNIEYIEECFELFEEDLGPVAATPAKSHLFETSEGRKVLDKKKHKTFHCCVAKLLYIAKRGRPDILTAISFLTIRVLSPDIDDWRKLKRVLQYSKGTINLKLTLGAGSLKTMKTWVDASYAPHNDIRSHTGGCISFGRGMVCCRSTKQKLNTKSSTEAELVGMNDVLPFIIWTKYFVEAQGHEIENNIIYQDKQSAMLMELNGRRSAGRQSRHINIRYF